MPDQDPEGLISREELRALADAFDRYAYSLLPGAPEHKEAKIHFEQLVLELYERKVKKQFHSLPLHEFQAAVRVHCKEFLKKN
jgi:hypothetical protein